VKCRQKIESKFCRDITAVQTLSYFKQKIRLEKEVTFFAFAVGHGAIETGCSREVGRCQS
jgi:hypothetical protein